MIDFDVSRFPHAATSGYSFRSRCIGVERDTYFNSKLRHHVSDPDDLGGTLHQPVVLCLSQRHSCYVVRRAPSLDHMLNQHQTSPTFALARRRAPRPVRDAVAFNAISNLERSAEHQAPASVEIPDNALEL